MECNSSCSQSVSEFALCQRFDVHRDEVYPDGGATVECWTTGLGEVIGGLEHVLLVPRFHYTNAVHPRQVRITGITKDGLFLVEEGKALPLAEKAVGLRPDDGAVLDTHGWILHELERPLEALLDHVIQRHPGRLFHFEEQEIRERRLRALDLGGKDGLFADVGVQE